MNVRTQIFGNTPLLATKNPKRTVDGSLRGLPTKRMETRTRDSRNGDRHRLNKSAVRIAHRLAEHSLVLVNVSQGGVMLEGELLPKLFDHVELHLANSVIECEVSWIKGNRIGLQFVRESQIGCSSDERDTILRGVIATNFPEISADAPNPEPVTETAPIENKRSECRHSVIWAGTIYYNHGHTPVRLRNISPVGASIESAAKLQVGGKPFLDLEEAGSVSATISWVNGEKAGLKFEESIDLHGFAHGQSDRARSDWQPPHYLKNKPVREAVTKHFESVSVDELRLELDGFLKR